MEVEGARFHHYVFVVYHHVDTAVHLVHTELVGIWCHWDQVGSIDLEAVVRDVDAAALKSLLFLFLFRC